MEKKEAQGTYCRKQEVAHVKRMRARERIAQRANSPLEADETISAVPVLVAISLAEIILIAVVAAKVERLEDPREQWQIGLAGMSLEEGAGIDGVNVGGFWVRSSGRYRRRGKCQY